MMYKWKQPTTKMLIITIKWHRLHLQKSFENFSFANFLVNCRTLYNWNMSEYLRTRRYLGHCIRYDIWNGLGSVTYPKAYDLGIRILQQMSCSSPGNLLDIQQFATIKIQILNKVSSITRCQENTSGNK
jgi:hypothetical protein